MTSIDNTVISRYILIDLPILYQTSVPFHSCTRSAAVRKTLRGRSYKILRLFYCTLGGPQLIRVRLTHSWAIWSRLRSSALVTVETVRSWHLRQSDLERSSHVPLQTTTFRSVFFSPSVRVLIDVACCWA